MQNEKRQIQLDLVTKMIEVLLFKVGFGKDFKLNKINIPIETRKKHLPMISLYEKIIKISTNNEIKSQPNFDMIFFGLANFYYNINEYSKALQKIDFLLTLDSCNVYILYSKGVLLELSKLPEKAIECYESILRIKPDHVAALYNKSVLDARSGRYDKAIESLDKIITIEPKHVLSQCDKGILLLEMSQFREAITCFNQVLDVNSKHLSAL
ncbi:MAG: tetratricopeptide repeat protein, partial [Nitrosotalea sp.]